jgi:hypothetical protein
MRRVALVMAAAIAAAILSPSTTAVATQPAAADEASAVASSQCCAPVWLPYGWFPTKAKCDAEGAKLKKEYIGVVDWQCRRQKGGGWKLYLLESA